MNFSLTKYNVHDQFDYPYPEGSELIVLVPFRVRVSKDDQFAEQGAVGITNY